MNFSNSTIKQETKYCGKCSVEIAWLQGHTIKCKEAYKVLCNDCFNGYQIIIDKTVEKFLMKANQ